jgi:hypothetical protein
MSTQVHTFKRSCQVQRLAVPIADAMSAATNHMFVISHGPDEEWFTSEEEAVDAAFDWSVETGGDTITVSRVHQGRTFPHMEVFA